MSEREVGNTPGSVKRLPVFWIFIVLYAASLACSKGMVLSYLDNIVPLGYNAGEMMSWFFVCGGLGWAAPALFNVQPNKIMLPSAAAYLLANIFQAALVGSPMAATVMLMASAFLGSAFHYTLICGMFREIPYNRRGTAFGLALGLSTLINLPTRLAGLPFLWLQSVAGQQVYSLFMVAVALLLLLLVRNRLAQPAARTGDEKERSLPARLIFWIMLCFFLMYTAYSMHNYMLDAYQFGRTAEFEYARIADVIACVAVGVICDRVSRPVTMIASAVLMMSGAAAMLTGFNGTVAVVLQALAIAGVYCFTIPVRLMLIDASFSSKRSYLICSLGFIGATLFQSIGAPVAEVFLPLGNVGLFAVSLVLCLFVIPCMTYIVERIRRLHVEGQRLVFAETSMPELNADADKLCQEYGLTKREAQVFGLSLGNRSAMEIAEDLMVSESTVRVHMGNIRRKMENDNGRRALGKVLAERDEALNIEQLVSRDSLQAVADQYGFTAREAEVFPLLLTPKTADEIASELYVSPSTIKTHIRNIITKTGVTNRRELRSLIEPENGGE